MAYAEDRFGEVVGAGTDYVIVGAAVPSSTKWNTLISLANVTSSTVLVRLYIASSSWTDHATSGEPDGAELKVRLLYDFPLAANDVLDLSGRILKATEKLVVRASAAASLDVCLSGTAIT